MSVGRSSNDPSLIFPRQEGTIPYTDEIVTLKQVALDKLSGLAADVFAYAIHAYVDPRKKEFDSKNLANLTARFGRVGNVTHISALPRRHAGDHTLARTSYYTVCNPDGDDDDTLVRELMS